MTAILILRKLKILRNKLVEQYSRFGIYADKKETAPPVGRAEDIEEVLVLCFFFDCVMRFATMVASGLVFCGIDSID